MTRIVKEIEVDGRTLKALFDSGSLRSYIKAEFRSPIARKVKPITVGLGGETLSTQSSKNEKGQLPC